MIELVTPEEIGDALQAKRTALGWTQDELARRAGVSRQWLIKVESGHPGAELGRLLAVIRVLGLVIALPDRQLPTAAEVDLDELFADEGEAP